MGQWRRRRKSKSAAENRRKSKVSQKSSQSVSVIEGSPSQPKTEGSRKSAKSRVSQSARNQSVSQKEVESQPEVESVSLPETSQSAGSAMAATIRWASGVVEGSPSQSPKIEGSPGSARSRVSQSVNKVSISRNCPGGHN